MPEARWRPTFYEHRNIVVIAGDRLMSAVHELSQTFALAVLHEEALRITDDVAFFQAVRAGLAKRAPGEAKTEEELGHAIRQIVSRTVGSEGVVDIFVVAGLKKPAAASRSVSLKKSWLSTIHSKPTTLR